MAWAVKLKLPTKEKFTLLMLANYASNERGDCYPSIEALCVDTGLSRSSVKRALSDLASMGAIEIVTRKVDGVHIPNIYRVNLEWQGSVQGGPGRFTQNRRSGHTEPGVGSHRTEGSVHGEPLNLSVEPVIEPINEPTTPPNPPSGGGAVADGFEPFWKAYPRKQARAAAEKSWKRLTREQQERALAALPGYVASAQWHRDGGQFIPHASTWLNQARFDELPGMAEAERPMTQAEKRQDIADQMFRRGKYAKRNDQPERDITLESERIA